MSATTLPLDLGITPGSLSCSGVFIGDLYHQPEAVAEGMRRELAYLDRQGLPAFADGRRIWTPTSSFFINENGKPSRGLCSAMNFDARARYVAIKMETSTRYSFNHTFAQRYLQEGTTNA